MGKSRVAFSLALAGAVLWQTGRTHAAITVNSLSDTGTLQNEIYAPPAITSVTLASPYGPLPPVNIVSVVNGVAVTNTFSLNFTLTSDFLANASSSSGGQSTSMDGTLNLLVTLASPGRLTTTVLEDGIWAQTGAGTVDVAGGVVVSEADTAASGETHGGLFPAETYAPTGTWALFDQVGDFSAAYTKYRVTVDTTLIAEALSGNSSGSAYLATKDFTLTFSTQSDGITAVPVPEPASLCVLALGGICLLRRRR